MLCPGALENEGLVEEMALALASSKEQLVPEQSPSQSLPVTRPPTQSMKALLVPIASTSRPFAFYISECTEAAPRLKEMGIFDQFFVKWPTSKVMQRQILVEKLLSMLPVPLEDSHRSSVARHASGKGLHWATMAMLDRQPGRQGAAGRDCVTSGWATLGARRRSILSAGKEGAQGSTDSSPPGKGTRRRSLLSALKDGVQVPSELLSQRSHNANGACAQCQNPQPAILRANPRRRSSLFNRKSAVPLRAGSNAVLQALQDDNASSGSEAAPAKEVAPTAHTMPGPEVLPSPFSVQLTATQQSRGEQPEPRAAAKRVRCSLSPYA